MAQNDTPKPIQVDLPPWATELIALYESNATNQFILNGNVNDRVLLPLVGKPAIGSLYDFLLRVLLPRFDVVLSYDLGNGIRVEKGEEIFSQWPLLKELGQQLPRQPRLAVEVLTQYFRFVGNLEKLGRGRFQVGCIIKSTQLLAPAVQGGVNYDLSAMATLIRDWSSDTLLTDHALATFLVTENLNDLHPLLVNNTRATKINIPLPPACDLEDALAVMGNSYKTALADFTDRYDKLAAQFQGATLGSIEGLLKTKDYRKQKLTDEDLVQLKKQLVEMDCSGLIEFIEPKKSLEDLHGQEKVKAWLRQDFALWKQNDLQAMPMGYLLCGPVGTGKTFTAECIAGEAGVPVVKLKNFRDKWVGSTEGNLEKIFRLLHALGRCFVFVDEADQTLGKRDSGGGDGGIGGRIYSMLAQEMSDTSNRGKIVWMLASSRPDLIEVDLKRPGRVDVKIPLFPTATALEGFGLLRALCKRRGVLIDESAFNTLEPLIPPLLTPGAAEALAVKIYRTGRTSSVDPIEAVRQCLTDYQSPIPKDVMDFQIALAVREASDLDFVPVAFRGK